MRAFLILLCLCTLGAGKRQAPSNAAPVTGAWLQTKLKWENAPATINPQLQTSRATILYFGDDHRFAMLMCVVNRVQGEYTTISDGDGLALWRGQWTADRKGIAVWYEFVPPRPRQWPEASIVGQPMGRAIIRRSRDEITFADMKFERESKLDDDAHNAMLTTSDTIELSPDR
jgi:hypothetical protein